MVDPSFDGTLVGDIQISKKTIKEKALYDSYVRRIVSLIGEEPTWVTNEYGEDQFDLVINGVKETGCHEHASYSQRWPGYNADLTIKVDLVPGKDAKFTLIVKHINESDGRTKVIFTEYSDCK